MAAALYEICKYEKISSFYESFFIYLYKDNSIIRVPIALGQKILPHMNMHRIRGEALWKREYIQYQKRCGSLV